MSLRSKYFLFITAGFLILTDVSIAQEDVRETVAHKEEVDGDVHYKNYAFMDARKSYLKAIESGYRSKNVLSRLGDTYYYNGDYQNASKWYELLFDLAVTIDTEYVHRYAQSLKSIGRYAAADRIMERINDISSTDLRGEYFSENRDYLKQIELRSGRYVLSPVPFNSDLSDFSPTFNGGEVVFASNRKTRSIVSRVHNWNNAPFTELYTVKLGEDEPTKFRGKVNSKFHEASATFTKDGQTMYFTRNNFTNKKIKNDSEGTNHLKIYRSKRTENGWGIAEELSINSDMFSNAHPTLSPDEKFMIFSSDRPGGKGQSDLYKVEINEGNFGEPVRLGDNINTEGRETFPFLDDIGNLYFASDGHVGLGGLDIFVSEPNKEGSYKDGINVGSPVNSKQDDFSFVINSTTGLGYFASNREGGMGEDDIYAFEQIESWQRDCQQRLSGEVRDLKTDEIIGDAKVVLVDNENNVLNETFSDEKGKFSFDEIDCSTEYAIRASKEKFSGSEKDFISTEVSGDVITKTLYIQSDVDKRMEESVVGDDLRFLLELNPIYFDLDESFIRPDAEIELLKIVKILNNYPTIKIDVRSHTDSRASDSYNMRLSDDRVKSTINYLVAAGIERDRLSGRGYGETQLFNNCGNGSECSEENHQMNRRSEFIIIAR